MAEQTMEHVVAHEARRLVVMGWPWPLWLLLWAAGWRLHQAWHTWGTAWMVVLAGLALAGLALHLTHHRKKITGRLLAPVTTLAAADWLALAEVYGAATRTELFRVWLIGGGTVALGWSMWLHIHDGGDEAGHALGLDEASTHTSVPGLRAWVTERLPNKVAGVIRHAPGITTAEVVKATGSLESARGLPPGTLQVTQHPDNAQLSKFVMTNPRLLDKPALWPGASRPGGSFAAPIRYGLFTDGTTCEVPANNYHVQIMGKTGAAKTTGPGYNELAETITRTDAAVLACDPAKRQQFLGPLAPALHEFATTPGDTRELFHAVLSDMVPQRTDYLATQGLTQWQKGCGLTHLTLWCEEASWVFNKCLTDRDIEKWVVPGVVAARSAAIRCAFSIQRADFTMMPTVIRAQMCRITCGCAGKDDAAFGLTDYQDDHGCDPARWGSEKPGMFYIDVDGVPDTYKVMAARSYWWGPDSTMIAQHARQWAIDAGQRQPLDRLAAATLGGMHHTMAQAAETSGQPAAPAKARPSTTLTGGQAQQPPAAAAAATQQEGQAMADYEPEDPDEPTGAAHDDGRLWAAAAGASAGDYAPGDVAADPAVADFAFGDPGAAPDNVTRLPQTLDQAIAALRRQVRTWWTQGATEITMDMVLGLTDDPDHENYIDRSRPWLYPAMAALVDDPEMHLEQHDGPRRWTRAA